MEKAFVKYVAALILFGTNGIVASAIALSSHEIVLLRTFIGSMLLIAIFAIARKPLNCLKHARQIPFIALSGVSMGAGWLFLFEAYKQIGVSLSSLLYYCGPIIVMALSPLMFGERLTPTKVIGFIVVLVGVFLVNGTALDGGVSGAGIALGACSALCCAALVLFNKKAIDIRGLENAMLQLAAAFLTVAVYTLARQGLAIDIPVNSWPAIIILGAINTGLGCYLYFSSIGYLSAQTVAVVGYVEPLSAVILGVLVLSEPMTILQAVGVVFIVGGAAFCELSAFRKVSPECSKEPSCVSLNR